jgi:hypothetical protein
MMGVMIGRPRACQFSSLDNWARDWTLDLVRDVFALKLCVKVPDKNKRFLANTTTRSTEESEWRKAIRDV